MEDTLNQIKKYIPDDVVEKLPRKKFTPGEVLLDINSDYFLLILDGTVHSIRYHRDKKIIYPYLWKKGRMAGFNMLLSKTKKNWEFVAATPGEALVFTADTIEKFIFQVPASFKFFVEKNFEIVEAGIKGFYILAHGGAKAYFALLLIKGSQKGTFSFRRYENFAEVLGVSKSMLFRITKELIEKKLIRKERKKIIILNPEGLKDLYREYLYF